MSSDHNWWCGCFRFSVKTRNACGRGTARAEKARLDRMRTKAASTIGQVCRSLRRMPGKPLLRAFMKQMPRPEESNQGVDVMFGSGFDAIAEYRPPYILYFPKSSSLSPSSHFR